MTKLDHALALIADGFWIFPLQSGGKKPPKDMHFKELATRDERQVREWFSDAADYNIGIYTGRFGDAGALLVVDVDNKKGKRGDNALLQLELEGCDVPDTRSTATPTGGRHLFYRVPQAVRQGVNKLGDGLDHRSGGGYVVAPGSAIGGSGYVTDRPLPLVDAPQWLIDRCGAERAERSQQPAEAPAGIDASRAVSRASDYLRSHAPLAVKGQGGDQTTYRVAARLKDLGVDEHTAWELMLEIWNPRCPPGWSPERLREKVRNAYHYGFEQPGISAPEVMFSKIETQPEKADRQRLYFEMFDEVQPAISRPELVEGLLDHGAMTVLYGQSNEGKTFVALDIGFAIARGTPWLGKDTEQGGVVYIAAEGGGNIKKRFKALRQHYEAKGVPMALVPCPVDLGGTGADVQPLLDLIAEAWAKTGKVVLLVVDTLSRAMAGGNENAPDDMTAFVRNVDRLRVAIGCHVLVVHHSGKDQAKGARGHSSLRAATDTEIEVANRTITATKQRDMESCAPIAFDLQPVEIGTNAKGRAVTSCVVVPSNRVAAEEFALKPLKGWAAKAFAVLQDMTAGGINPAGKVHRDEWKAELVRLYLSDKDPKVANDTARRAIHQVLEANRAIMETDYARPV